MDNNENQQSYQDQLNPQAFQKQPYQDQAYQQQPYQDQAYQQQAYQQQAYQQPYQQQPYQQQFYQQPMVSEEYKPISMWGYVGYFVLFSLPLVGIIMLIIYAVSSTNRNLKNYSRAMIIWIVICFAIFILFYILVGAALLTTASYY